MNIKSISLKLFFVCFTFMIPIGVMNHLMTQAKNKDITFGSQEMKGNVYQAQLTKIFEQLSSLRFSLNFEKKQNVVTLNKISKEIENLQQIDSKIGKDLEFTTEGLAKRKRTEFNAANLLKSWTRFLENTDKTKQIEILTTMSAHLKNMITHAAMLLI